MWQRCAGAWLHVSRPDPHYFGVLSPCCCSSAPSSKPGPTAQRASWTTPSSKATHGPTQLCDGTCAAWYAPDWVTPKSHKGACVEGFGLRTRVVLASVCGVLAVQIGSAIPPAAAAARTCASPTTAPGAACVTAPAASNTPASANSGVTPTTLIFGTGD